MHKWSCAISHGEVRCILPLRICKFPIKTIKFCGVDAAAAAAAVIMVKKRNFHANWHFSRWFQIDRSIIKINFCCFLLLLLLPLIWRLLSFHFDLENFSLFVRFYLFCFTLISWSNMCGVRCSYPLEDIYCSTINGLKCRRKHKLIIISEQQAATVIVMPRSQRPYRDRFLWRELLINHFALFIQTWVWRLCLLIIRSENLCSATFQSHRYWLCSTVTTAAAAIATHTHSITGWSTVHCARWHTFTKWNPLRLHTDEKKKKLEIDDNKLCPIDILCGHLKNVKHFIGLFGLVLLALFLSCSLCTRCDVVSPALSRMCSK